MRVADLHVLSAAFKLGATFRPHDVFRVECIVLWNRTIAVADDGERFHVASNERGRRLYERIRRQERHRVNMTWPAYREEYTARVHRMKGRS